MYKKIYVPLDNSDHSMAAIEAAVELGKAFDAELVGCHAYAAKMHDVRFKQMEFTLPDEYLIEGEMEKQRKVHDTLITMGLELISDSYNVVMQKRCIEEGLPFEAKMLEGKNYKVLAADINESDYDLVIMGSLGLAAVRDSLIGSVCERVVRRIKTDTLVIKDTSTIKSKEVSVNDQGEIEVEEHGNIVVAVDGSPESFAGLKTAIELGKSTGRQVEAIAVYDPYMHYAMFNSLVTVLTEKAAKVFKFKEQEQLHEDVIDTGLAKIFQSHLEIARKVAEEDGVDLKITLLDGKAFEKIIQYVRREKPWLLVLGRIGVHSDQDMDIGSNTENLLRLAPCNVLLSSKRYVPALDIKAEESMTWLQPATDLLNTAPEFVRPLARTTIHRWAMERGHSVITRKVIEQAMSSILPKSSLQKMGIIAEEVAKELTDVADTVTYICGQCGYAAKNFTPVTCGVCGADGDAFHKLDRETIENLAPLEGGVSSESTFDDVKLNWTAEAKALLAEVPEGYQRRRARAQIEKTARVKQLQVISRELVEEATGVTSKATINLEPRGKLTASAIDGAAPDSSTHVRDGKYSWTADAVERINRVPEGYMRNITKSRIEGAAKAKGIEVIDLALAEEGIAIGRKLMEEMIAKQERDKAAKSGQESPGGSAEH